MIPTNDKDKADLQLPNITVKIVRRGEILQLKAGKYTLQLQEVPNKSQTYPLLLLDKFVTQVTTILLNEQVKRQQAIQDLKGLTGGIEPKGDKSASNHSV